MSIKKGQNLGGIHCVADIIRRLTPDGDCLVWTGYCTSGGIPFAKIGGRSTPVRTALAKMLGKKTRPRTRTLMQSGCHAKCCNPDHLRVVSVAEYIREMTVRGIINGPVQLAAARKIAREINAKITPQIAESIRARRQAGEPVPELATEYDLSESHVYRILRGQAWAGPMDAANGSSVFAWRPAA